jgi:hypothetical protein
VEEIEKMFYSESVEKIAWRLRSLENKEKAYKLAETYCDKVCRKWVFNPMSCAYNCEIWKLKNETLSRKRTQK